MDEISKLLRKGELAIDQASDLKTLEALRIEYLGKQGHFTQALKILGTLPPTDRPKAGQIINQAKEAITDLLQTKKQNLESKVLGAQLKAETIDVTLPGRGMRLGQFHPITLTLDRIIRWYEALGFSVEEGPDIEDDYHNFEALNIPSHHPARAMHDTFYFPDGRVLRTHTSPVQIRVMKTQKPPFRFIAIGKAYRCDFDISHTPQFHQVEGFMVDEHIHFGNLKGVLEHFLQFFFEQEHLKARFRPSYFPFTEPSAEVDIQCVKCQGKGCRICSHTGWLEILGCGMVHPKVLENCGVDPKRYRGFAFGMGVERVAMLRYGIDDIRLLFENDLRFLEQFY